MKIVADDKIPYLKGAFEPYAEVVYLPGNAITSREVKDADALITRTRTICNRDLLKNSSVRFIATATIGFDHIDTAYCKQAGIHWTNAQGCNAESVNQYVASALYAWSLNIQEDPANKTIGIVGVGKVGSKVEALCKTLGMKVLLNDPPRERREGPGNFVPLSTVLEEADILTFHVPLNLSGKDRTFHMVDQNRVKKLRKNPLLINASRGEVFDSRTLIQAKKTGLLSGFIIDCWENEPDIDLELLKICTYGTPHIAGYSKDGKANGTRMSVQAISRFFNLGINDWEPTGIEEPPSTVIKINGKRKKEYEVIAEAILATYNIEADDKKLRDHPQWFEKLRGDYPVRREFTTYTLKANNVNPETINKMRTLGFTILDEKRGTTKEKTNEFQ
jgi:erythronate-4-phosphate dehydrogenase